MASTASPSSGRSGLETPRRYWAMLAVGLALTMSVIDATIANVALPTIADDMHAEPSFAIWIVNAYQMAIMLSLLPLAALGDIIGYSRVYLGGLVLFTIASLTCSLSDSLPMLVGARVLQGFGASGIMSVNMAVVRFIYPTSFLGRGIGLNAVIIAISAAVGPTIASAILSVATWPWLFAVNVPIGIVAVGIGSFALPASPHQRRPFDYISAALSALTFGLLIVFIDTLGRRASLPTLAGEAGAMLIAGAFLVRRQMWVDSPMLPIDLLRIPIFGLSIGTSICSFVAQAIALVSLPFLLQDNLGYSAVGTGLLMTPWPLATSVLAPISGRLSDRYPAGLLGSAGLVLFGAGLAALAFVPAHAGIADVAWRMALAGAGFGLYQSPNNRTIIASAPRARSGGAAGMQGMARLLGQTVGAALAALFFGLMDHTEATVVAPAVGALFAIIGAVISGLRLTDLAAPSG